MKDELNHNIVALFGKNIKYFRTLRSLTQSQLAEKINKTEETISNIERGVSVAKITVINPLAKALNVSIDELFCFENEKPLKTENITLIKQINILLNKQNTQMLQILKQHIENLEIIK